MDTNSSGQQRTHDGVSIALYVIGAALLAVGCIAQGIVVARR